MQADLVRKVVAEAKDARPWAALVAAAERADLRAGCRAEATGRVTVAVHHATSTCGAEVRLHLLAVEAREREQAVYRARPDEVKVDDGADVRVHQDRERGDIGRIERSVLGERRQDARSGRRHRPRLRRCR